MRKFISLICLVCSLSGCATWPQHGYGGAAETMAIDPRSTDNHKRLNAAEQNISNLTLQGAQAYFPAAFITLTIQYDRTVRTVEGDFNLAAQLDLERLDILIINLQKSLHSISMTQAELISWFG